MPHQITRKAMIAQTTEEPTKRICTVCRQCLPIESFGRERNGVNRRRSRCNKCRVAQDRKSRTEADRKLIRNSSREIRKSRVWRMAAIVESLVDHFGGPNRFVRRYRALYEDGSPSYQLRAAETISRMSLAIEEEKLLDKQLVLKEHQLEIERVRAGDFGKLESLKLKLSDDELVRALCDAVRMLSSLDLLPHILKRMTAEGAFDAEELNALWSALS